MKRVIDTKRINERSPGMYFMECYEDCNRQSKQSNDTSINRYFEYAGDFYLTLGYACQARTEDLDYAYGEGMKENESDFDEAYIDFLKGIKKDVYTMFKVASRIDDSDMMDMKGNESVGEYADRKLLASKRFMEKYDYFVSFDFKAFYDQNIKEEIIPA